MTTIIRYHIKQQHTQQQQQQQTTTGTMKQTTPPPPPPPPLSDAQIQEFLDRGYLLVPNVLEETMCTKLMTEINHIMDNNNMMDNNSMNVNITETIKHFSTGDYDNNQHDEIPGIMLRKTDGTDPFDDHQHDWLLTNQKLRAILDQLHNNNNNNNKSWQWIHPHNLGWIHIRFPLHNPSQFQHRWHIDGAHFSPHRLLSPEQSVVVLPVLHNIRIGGGNTMVLPGSHSHMARILHKAQSEGIEKQRTQDCRSLANDWPEEPVEIAPAQAGDVLILHPLLIHAAGFQKQKQKQKQKEETPFRITFNLGTRWSRQPSLSGQSCLEQSLRRAVTELKYDST